MTQNELWLSKWQETPLVNFCQALKILLKPFVKFRIIP